jgi:hypothetical protein
MTAPGLHQTLVRHWLTGIEAVTGATALVGGALLIARPSGELIGARSTALAGSPFDSWLVPGILLLVLVGAGYLGAALSVAVRARVAPALSVAAGLGLVVFEICEVLWLGFQPLEVAFMTVGLAVVVLGLELHRT